MAKAAGAAPAVQVQPEQFYVKQNDAVRTLGADQIRLEVASGGVRPDALICKVGDTQWRGLRDAAAIGVELPSLPPIPQVATSTPDEMPPFARAQAFQGRGVLGRLAQVKNKGTVLVWALSFTIGITVVLQRNGTLYSLADGWDLRDEYEAFEKSVFGGPGEGTARSAERLWDQVVPEDRAPFSKVEARVKAKREGTSQPAP